MSYCRWSSDFFECDVYVYADVSGGWTTHVAGRKSKHRLPDEIKAMYHAVEWGKDGAPARWTAAHKAEDEWRKSLPHEVLMARDTDGNPSPCYLLADSEYYELPPPHAGESYNDATPGECADRLEQLRAAGFRVPQYAIDDLRAEQADMDNALTDESI